VVEEIVVVDVDKELGAGRVRIVGASHGNGAYGVGGAAFGLGLSTLVLDGRACWLFHITSVIASTLDHEVIDHTVKNRTVVMAITHIGHKVLNGVGCFVGIEFHHKFARGGGEFHLRCCRGGVLSLGQTQGGQGQGHAEQSAS
jgi:hypothetical protein